MNYRIVDETLFDEIFEHSALIVDFQTDDEEEAYVQLDRQLIDRISEVCSEYCKNDDGFTFEQLEDWWPNHTRYLYIAEQCFSANIVCLLHEIILNNPDWRIQIILVTKLPPHEQTGMALLSANQCLLTGAATKILGLNGESAMITKP